MSSLLLTRRVWLLGASMLAASTSACAQTRPSPSMRVFKTPTCACCDAWVQHLRDAGFGISITVMPSLRSVRSSHGMPEALASCHTGLIETYVVEGHVPADDIKRLLRERPQAVGLAVPGMPLGSPGMETADGQVQPYETLLVLASGQTRVFARHPSA
ncbi:MAG: DUF411 domain-containing protein [Brevundimonas aurantiaca]|nr:DUF411 domain-containing protein [Brevundimonas sp.]